MKAVGIAVLGFALTGCTAPWTAWTLKHDARIAAQDAAVLKAQTDQLQAGYAAQSAANDALIAGLKATAAVQATRRAAVDTYVSGAHTVLTDAKLPDPAKVGAATVLVGYAQKNGDPVPAEQLAWINPIVQQLEAQDAADVSAGKAALAAKQGQLDLAKVAEGVQIEKNGALEAAKEQADAKVQTLSQQVDAAKAKITATLGTVNAYLAKYSWLRSVVVSTLWAIGITVGIGAVLAILSIIYPPLYPVSKLYRTLVGGFWKLVFMPIHALYDLIEQDLTKPAAPVTATPSATATATTTVQPTK